MGPFKVTWETHPEGIEKSGIPSTPLQSYPYELTLSEQGCFTYRLSILGSTGTTVSTWLLFTAPRNRLFLHKDPFLSAVDLHVRAYHGPCFAPEVSADEKKEVGRILLEALKSFLEEVKPASAYFQLNPLWTAEEGALFCELAESLGFKGKKEFTYLKFLGPSEKEPMTLIKPDRRTNIRKAEAAGVEVREAKTLLQLADYYRIRRETILRNRTGPVPWNNFVTLFESLYPKGVFKVFLCYLNEKPLAGQTLFVWNNYVYLAGVSLSREAVQNRIPANDFLQWKILEWAKNEGYRTVDFVGANPDSTDPKAKAIDFFKSRWGTVLSPVFSLEYPISSWRRTLEPFIRPFILLSRLWQLRQMKRWSYAG